MYWWERFSECGKKTYLDQNPPAPLPKGQLYQETSWNQWSNAKKLLFYYFLFLFFWGYIHMQKWDAVWLYSVTLTVSFISPQWSQFLLPATVLHLFHLDLLAIPSELQMLSIDHMSNCVNYESTSEIPNGVICSPVLWDHIYSCKFLNINYVQISFADVALHWKVPLHGTRNRAPFQDFKVFTSSISVYEWVSSGIESSITTRFVFFLSLLSHNLDFANVVDVWRIESKDPQNLRGMCFACKYDVCMIEGWIRDVCFQASWQPLTESLRPWVLWVLVGCKEPPLPLTNDL